MKETYRVSSPILSLRNTGSFEGFVGKRPEIVENKKGTRQCFLHVGHTPLYRGKDGKLNKEKRPVWIHFACFGPLADFAVQKIKIGQRVMVDYKVTAKFDRRVGIVPAFQAVVVRPIAKVFDSPDEPTFGGDTSHLWRPATARGDKWSEVEEEVTDENPGIGVDDEEHRDVA